MGYIGYYRDGSCYYPVSWGTQFLNIPFAVLGLLFSVLVLIVSSKKELAVAGCILCSVAIFLGTIRLVLGFGIF